MKTEIYIPPPYAELLEAQAAEQGVTPDELTENAVKNYLERGDTDAGE
ncbi:MAG: CopG family transcriptional regulator [Ruminococcus sp.]|nr:CopG family transcriptional regulator [Ruminococcus sp.]